MDNLLDQMMLSLSLGRALTFDEQANLLRIVKLAAAFTDANDRSDDCDSLLDEPVEVDFYEAEAAYAALGAAANEATNDYNRTKADLFRQVRSLMGWPAREPAQTHATTLPHPFAQEGAF